MDVYEFPAEYEEKIQSDIERIREKNRYKSRKIAQEYEAERKNKNNIIRNSNNRDEKYLERSLAAEFVFEVFLIGLVVGFFVCCKSFMNSGKVGKSLKEWLVTALIGLVLGLIGIVLGYFDRKRNIKNLENSIDDDKRQLNRETEQLDSEMELEIRNVKKEFEKYCSEFEIQSQKMSFRFEKSQLTVMIVDWMSEGYIRMIQAMNNRANSIDSINIPFNYSVYKNSIICDLGVFDFDSQRCKELESPLEQAALAKAIASGVKNRIVRKFTESDNELIPYVDLSIKYSLISADIVLTYLYKMKY